MLELGKMQTLIVKRRKEFGIYLGEQGDDEHAVLLPAKQVPEGAKEGDEISVFLYKDSQDRLIATTQMPKLQLGEAALLEVQEVSRIGAFLDMGLEKELLLPFKEQLHPVVKGEKCLAALYVDRSGRLAATMHVYSHMRSDSPYKKDDIVKGTVYEIKDIGVFVAVDNRYYGLIPPVEMYRKYIPGETVEARVMRVREDGKLDLSPRQKVYLQMDEDVKTVWESLEKSEGKLPFNDKSAPEEIMKEFSMSKAAFKRAVGRLLKEGKITITENGIEVLK